MLPRSALLEYEYAIRTAQEVLTYPDVSATMNYTHVLNHGGRGLRTPARSLETGLDGQLLWIEYTEVTFGVCWINA